MGKAFSLLLRMSQLTKVETNHRSLNLILGSSSSVLQLLCFKSPLAQGKAKGLGQWEYVNVQRFFLYFSFSKWDPYPFFYRLEGARYLDKPSAMHGWEFQLTHPYLFVLSTTFLFSCFCRSTRDVLGQPTCTHIQ
jgi:hypothetical protein